MFESSLFIRWLSKPVRYIIWLWKNSLAYRLICRLSAWFMNIWHHSRIISWFKKDGLLVRTWQHSAVLRFTDWLANLIPNFLGSIYARLERWFRNSFLYRLLDFASGHVSTLIALFVMASLVIPYSRWNNRYTTLAVLFFFGLFLIRTMGDRSVRFAVKAIDLFLFLFLLSIFLAQVFSTYPSLSLRFLAFYGTDFLMMLILISTIRTKKDLSTVLEIIMIGVALAGLYGLYQGIVGVPVNQAQVDVELNEGMPGRVESFFGNSNIFAQNIVLFAPFFAAIVLSAKGWQKKALFTVAALPPLVALLMTYSRSGYVGLAVAVLVFIFLVKRSLIPLFAVLGIAAMPFLPDTVLRRISTITNFNDSSISYRFDIFMTMWQVITDFWYTGIGLGSDAVKRVTENYEIFTKSVPLHAHNVYFQIWLEMGIMGLVAFIGWMVRTVKCSLRVIFSEEGDPYLKHVLRAGVSGLLGLLVIALVEYIWYYPRAMMLFWIFMGIVLSAIRLAAREPEEEQGNA
ncbi:MAG TPA: O-antigen ligase family protein [Thermoclostridium caenicola]|nr:O-antigen ligase family protein [Thermoclostridium caenicola]